jgi:hypothetical protein
MPSKFLARQEAYDLVASSVTGGKPPLTSGRKQISARRSAKALPDANVLREILKYEDASGRLYWRARPLRYFRSEREQLRWNYLHADKEALKARQKDGSRFGKIFGDMFFAHRVIWKIKTGDDPLVVDHINGDPGDNRWANIRSCTYGDNLRNRRIPSNNSSGKMGVSYDKTNGKWVAVIYYEHARIHLGVFHNKDAAIAARTAAEKKYGYHENHGRAE